MREVYFLFIKYPEIPIIRYASALWTCSQLLLIGEMGLTQMSRQIRNCCFC